MERNRRSDRKKTRRVEQVPNLGMLTALAVSRGVEDDPRVKKLLWTVKCTRDPEIALDALEYIEALAAEYALNPDPFRPAPSASETWGEYEIGVVDNSGCVFGLRQRELPRHVFASGSSGEGKTTFFVRLGSEVLEHETDPPVKLIIFDRKGGDYSKLARGRSDVWEISVPGPEFRWNPLEPPFPDFERWCGISAPVQANAHGLQGGQGSEIYEYKAMLDVGQKYDTDAGVYPSPYDLRDALTWMKANKKVDRYTDERNWHARVLSRMENICYAFGETVNCSRGFPLGEILGHHNIFDISMLKPDAANYFVEMFLTQAIWYRRMTGEKGGVLRNVAIFDEGKAIFSARRGEGQNAVSNISQITAMAREYGFSLCVGDNDASQVSDTFKKSAYARICFNQTHGEEVREAALSLGLDREQAQMIQRLEVGQAIVRLADRIDGPFVVRITP